MCQDSPGSTDSNERWVKKILTAIHDHELQTIKRLNQLQARIESTIQESCAFWLAKLDNSDEGVAKMEYQNLGKEPLQSIAIVNVQRQHQVCFSDLEPSIREPGSRSKTALRISDIPTFSGEELRQWIAWMDEFFEREGYIESEKLTFSQSFIDGEAEYFVNMMRFENWGEMKRALWLKFGEIEDQERIQIATENKRFLGEFVTRNEDLDMKATPLFLEEFSSALNANLEQETGISYGTVMMATVEDNARVATYVTRKNELFHQEDLVPHHNCFLQRKDWLPLHKSSLFKCHSQPKEMQMDELISGIGHSQPKEMQRDELISGIGQEDASVAIKITDSWTCLFDKPSESQVYDKLFLQVMRVQKQLKKSLLPKSWMFKFKQRQYQQVWLRNATRLSVEILDLAKKEGSVGVAEVKVTGSKFQEAEAISATSVMADESCQEDDSTSANELMPDRILKSMLPRDTLASKMALGGVLEQQQVVITRCLSEVVNHVLSQYDILVEAAQSVLGDVVWVVPKVEIVYVLVISEVAQWGMTAGGGHDVLSGEVRLHPLICDVHGHKLSKFLGNGIDPLGGIHDVTFEGLNTRLTDGHLDPKELVVVSYDNKRLHTFALCGKELSLGIVQYYDLEIRALANLSSFEAMLTGDDKGARAGLVVDYTEGTNHMVYVQAKGAVAIITEAVHKRIRTNIEEIQKEKQRKFVKTWMFKYKEMSTSCEYGMSFMELEDKLSFEGRGIDRMHHVYA